MADELGAVTLTAPAKVNLGLSVTTRRGDGFHEIETIMARLDLADELAISLAGRDYENPPAARAGPTVTLTVSGGDAAHDTLPTDDRNLVVRAATAYLRNLEPERSHALKVHVDLIKRVPIAAGLGGGSSDAATTLLAMARLLPAPVDLHALGLSIGSDVPFFLTQWGAALARGRGERLSRVELPEIHLVLVTPPFGVSAAEAYASLAGFTPRLRSEDIVSALSAGEEPGWRNALQPGVLRAYPAIRAVLATLRDAGLRGCTMSGSGPTCFGVADDRVTAESLARDIGAAQPTWRAVAASVR
jgi:4-diphosphocytidyl-2-C-methyl-D-erythritol kinase